MPWGDKRKKENESILCLVPQKEKMYGCEHNVDLRVDSADAGFCLTVQAFKA